MDKDEVKIVQFQSLENGHIIILLSNGKMYKNVEYGGPWYWKELSLLEDLTEYLGKEEITS